MVLSRSYDSPVGAALLVCSALTWFGQSVAFSQTGAIGLPVVASPTAYAEAGPVVRSTAFSDLLAGTDSRAGPRRYPVEPPPPDTLPDPGAGRNERRQAVWGVLELRGFPAADHIAPNGKEFRPLFLLGNDFNVMLWHSQGLYLSAQQGFWGQKAGPGITNPTQGPFDFSKREFDFDIGLAWNYTGPWEARLFAYSSNNFNRGSSLTSPTGFKDGVGVENRYYLSETYSRLGTPDFDIARATFLSVGYYATKSMVDANGDEFKPGFFARAYLTYDLWGPRCYLYADAKYISARSFSPTLLNFDAGLATRPFDPAPQLEFRVGTQDVFDLKGGDPELGLYLSIRYVY